MILFFLLVSPDNFRVGLYPVRAGCKNIVPYRVCCQEGATYIDSEAKNDR